jgi:hypothetical protein
MDDKVKIRKVAGPTPEQIEVSERVTKRLLEVMCHETDRMMAGGDNSPIDAGALCLGLAHIAGVFVSGVPAHIQSYLVPQMVQEIVGVTHLSVIIAEVKKSPTSR